MPLLQFPVTSPLPLQVCNPGSQPGSDQPAFGHPSRGHRNWKNWKTGGGSGACGACVLPASPCPALVPVPPLTAPLRAPRGRVSRKRRLQRPRSRRAITPTSAVPAPPSRAALPLLPTRLRPELPPAGRTPTPRGSLLLHTPAPAPPYPLPLLALPLTLRHSPPPPPPGPTPLFPNPNTGVSRLVWISEIICKGNCKSVHIFLSWI